MVRALIVAAVLVSGARPGAAQVPGDAAAPPPREVSTARRWAAIGAAIMPGIVLRGAGTHVIGEKRAARQLARTAAAGLGAMLVGGLAVGVTGAHPYTVVRGVPLVIAGAGLVLPTWFADLWVAAGGGRIDRQRRAASPWTVELGTTYLRDPFRRRALVRAAGTLELGRLGLGAATLVDAEGVSRTGDAEVRWRLRGAPATATPIRDGSKLHVRAAYRHHRDDADDVTLQTAEAEAIARLDLQHVDRVFDGNFLEVSSGLGIERATYPRDARDTGSLLLGRFAWGVYVGPSELSLFYDHRRDSLAGGFAAGRAAGFVGSFGAAAHLRIGGPWTFHGEVEIGNATVTTLALRYDGGAS